MTRHRILLATIDLVADRGYAGATMRQIAAGADMTIGTVFYHFASKADLVAAAHVEVIEPLLERTYAAARAQTGFLPGVVAWLQVGGEVLQECPAIARFGAALLQASEADGPVRRIHDHLIQRQVDVLRELAEAHADELELPGHEWQAVADAAQAMVIGLIDFAEHSDVRRSQAARAAAVTMLARSIGPALTTDSSPM
ncbi:AcrR family transcriptional regulator [Nakamurella sp. UYEF19]|uniref:TetR/AcrR family transcriptional regulator n=1 Tax=Nakamurella sp. UYEF19 TaxID=1756392 RepID=UPI00339224A7